MKKFLISLFLLASWLSVAAQTRTREPELWDVHNAELTKLPTYEYEEGRWVKYRQGENNNLRINAIRHNGNIGYVLSQNYTTMARDHRMNMGMTPVYVFHEHYVYSGCILSSDQLTAVKNIAPGEIVMVSSVNILLDHEAHDYEDYLKALYMEDPYPEQQFFLCLQRTKRRKKEVVRMIDSDDIGKFKKTYWEIPYEKFTEMFDGLPLGGE